MLIAFAFILLLYLACLVPLGWALSRTLVALSAESRSREVYEGLAFSCIIAVLAALLLTRGMEPQPSILGWLTFVVACGLSIWLPDPMRFKDVVVCAIAPSIALLGSLLAIFFIPYWLSGVFGAMISTTQPIETPDVYPVRALGFIFFVFIISMPAISISIYARNILKSAIKLAIGDNSKSLGNIEKSINTATRLITAIAAIFVVWK